MSIENFDTKTAKILVNKYGASRKMLCQWTNHSYNTIIKYIYSDKDNSDYSWVKEQIPEEIVVDILSMIESLQTEQILNNRKYVILRCKEETAPENAIVVLSGKGDISVYFKFPSRIKEVLIRERYHLLSKTDLEIKRNLRPVTLFGETKVIIPDKKIFHMMKNRRCSLGIDRFSDYVKHLGIEYEYLDGNILTDEDILNILRNHSVNNTCLLSSSHRDYKVLERKGRQHQPPMTAKEVIRFFDFETPIHITSKEKQLSRYKKEIEKSNYLIAPGEVYFPSTDNSIYQKLYSYGKKQTPPLTVNEVLNLLGYKIARYRRECSVWDILKELSTLQTEVDKIKTSTDRQKRNPKMVELLKELYGNKCQLCSESSPIPLS